MITTSNNIDKTDAELSQLRSLDELRRRRQEAARLRKLSMDEARKPSAPLAVQVSTTNVKGKQKANAMTMQTLEELDAIYSTTELLSRQSPLDAIHIARGLLKGLLRLCYARVQGKPLTNPEPSMVPMKLFQKGVLTKTVMRRIKTAVEQSSSVSNLLECCRALLVWLASDINSMVGMGVEKK